MYSDAIRKKLVRDLKLSVLLIDIRIPYISEYFGGVSTGSGGNGGHHRGFMTKGVLKLRVRLETLVINFLSTLRSS